MKRRDWLLYLVVAIVAVIGFLFFGVFFKKDVPQYTSEIAAAILGSLITVIITMILLNRQSENDTIVQRNAEILKAKLDLYATFNEQVKRIMTNPKLDDDTELELQMLNQRLAYLASEDVIEGFRTFVETFNEYSPNGLTRTEKVDLIKQLSTLSPKIRADLGVTGKALTPKEQDELAVTLEDTAQAISREFTTTDQFLAKCDDVERQYFGELVRFLGEQRIECAMGTVGFAIKNQAHQSRMWFYPTSARRSIEIQYKNLHSQTLQEITRILGDGGRAVEAARGRTRLSVRPREVSIAQMKQLILLMTGRKSSPGPD